jgi:hypothetical protein
MNTIKKVENFAEFLTESIENVVNTVERVHQTALDIPIDMLKSVGLPEETAVKVKDKQHQLVGSVYKAIRATNQQVGNMANEICDGLEGGIEAIQNLELGSKPAADTASNERIQSAA